MENGRANPLEIRVKAGKSRSGAVAKAMATGSRGTRHYVAAASARPVFFQWKFGFLTDPRPRMVKDSDCEKIAAGPPMTRYLLPCSCSHRIAVGPGQAGGTITCPGCGAAVAVPRLGALTRLDAIAADATVASSRDWNGARAWVLAGVAAAVVGTVTAGWLHGLRVGVAPFDESLIRATVEAAAVDQVHAAWLTFEQQGVSRPALPEETRRQRRAAALEGLEIIAWGAAAAGVVVAIVAAIPACRPRRGGGRA